MPHICTREPDLTYLLIKPDSDSDQVQVLSLVVHFYSHPVLETTRNACILIRFLFPGTDQIIFLEALTDGSIKSHIHTILQSRFLDA